MNTPRILTRGIAALVLTATVRAQTWDGGGANDNLNTGPNWNPNGVPISTADVIFAGTVRLTPNVSAPLTFNSLTFNNTAGAFIFGGASTLSINAGGLVSNDTTTQTFNNPVSFALAATSTINAASGALALNGAVTLPTATLTLDGANAISFGSTISGTGTIAKIGTGAFNFDATATAIGADFNLNAGITTLVATGTTQTFSSTSTIAVNASADFFINESLTLNGAQLLRASTANIFLAAGKTLTIQNGGGADLPSLSNLNASTAIVVTGAGSRLTVPNILQLGNGNTTNVLAGGRVFGGGAVTIGIFGTGTVTVDGSGSSFDSAPSSTVDIGTFGGTGNLAYSNGSTGTLGQISVPVASGGSFGTLNILSSASVSGVSLKIGTGAIGNSGTVTISGAGSALTITSAGTNVIGGTGAGFGRLNVQSGGVFSSGVFGTTIDANGAVSVVGATYNADGDHTLIGGGQLNVIGGAFNLASGKTLSVLTGSDASFSGQLNLNTSRTLTVTGTGSTVTANAVTIGNGSIVNLSDSATLTTGAGTTLLQSGGTVNITDSTATFGGPISRTGGVLNFNSGVLGIVDDFTVGTGGLVGVNFTTDVTHSFTTTGTTTIDPLRTLTINGGTFSTGGFVNNGTLDFQRGTLAITGAGGFNIGTGALGANVALVPGSNLLVTNTVTIASGAALTLVGGAFTGGTLNNSGTLRVNLGAASASAVTNSSGGRIFVGDTLTTSGAWTNAAGATLTLETGGLVNGAGTITNTGLVNGDGTIAKPFTNASGGEIRGDLGKTLFFTGTNGANAGRVNLLGGTVQFSQQFTNAATGQINGQGALYFPATPVPTSASPNAGLMNAGNFNVGGDTQVFGTVQMQAGSRLIVSGGATASFFDVFRHSGAEVRTSTGANTAFFGDVRGAGIFTGTGTVNFEGGYSPGNSPALVTFGGNVVYGSTNTVFMEVGGTTRGSQYDAIDVTGKLTFAGGLTVSLISGFQPQFGNVFNLFDWGTTAGIFTTVTLPALTTGLLWSQANLYTAGELQIVLDLAVASRTWDGGGVNNAWSTDANWITDVEPLNNGAASLLFAGNVRLAPSVDTPWNVAAITFDNTAGAFTINGPQGITIGAGGITNSDTQTQTITAAITLSANESFNAAAGDLSISSVALAGQTLALSGANDVTLATASGTGTINKNNTSRLDITGALGTGGVTLNANTGATNIGSSETLAALNIANGATVTLGTILPLPAPEVGDIDALLGASTQAVPEPGTWSLVAAALLCLGARRKSGGK